MLFRLCFAILILSLGLFARGQLVRPSQCPQVEVMAEFDLNAYLGRWFEYSKYTISSEVGKRCIASEYGDRGTNHSITVFNTAYNSLMLRIEEKSGYGYLLGPATFSVVFSGEGSDTTPNYLVLGTDYSTYSVVYSCTNIPLFHREYLWILTRSRTPSAATVAAAESIVDDNSLSRISLVKTVQRNCPFSNSSHAEYMYSEDSIEY